MPILMPFSESDFPLSVVYEYRISTKSRIIYISLVLTVVTVFACLPFIKIPVSVKCSGVIQAGTPRSDQNPKAYCYIKPSDIGMIKIGQQVSFQIDALNYRTWGLLSGRVLKISNDLILLENDVAVFKIECSLDKDYFEIEGLRVYFKKGMSLSARFKTGDYSLLQLIHCKANDPDFYTQS